MRCAPRILSLALLPIATLPLTQTKPYIEASKWYVGDNLVIKGLGACSVTDSAVDCWDMEGIRDKRLTAAVNSCLTSQHQQTISLYFGGNNRYLVFEKPTAPFGMNYSTLSGQMLYQSFGSGNLQLLLYDPNEGSKEMSVLVTIYGLPGPKAIDIPFRPGAEGRYLDEVFTIGPSRPLLEAPFNSPYFYNPMGPGKSWQFILGGEGYVPGHSIQYAAINRKGEVVSYVDQSGKEVSSIEYLNSLPPGTMTGSYGLPPVTPDNRYRQALVNQRGPTAVKAFTLETNVNPSQIKSLRVSGTVEERVLIKGFPLDPKS